MHSDQRFSDGQLNLMRGAKDTQGSSSSLKKCQLTLSQGKMKNDNDVADDEDDDAVSTSVSQD